jgi:hypothetical protein
MSTFTHLSNKNIIIVPSQSDDEYNIANDKTILCVCLFAINYEELRKTFLKNREDFINIYKKCLEDTLIKCNENININDKTILFEKLNLSNKIFKILTYEENNDFTTLIFYKFCIVSGDIFSFILINIYGYFLVLNSQEHIVQFITSDETFKYIRDKVKKYNDLNVIIFCCS